MSLRYAAPDELADALVSVGLSALGDANAITAAHTVQLSDAEQWVDDVCDRTFTPLAQWQLPLHGRGTATLRVPKVPIFDLQQISIAAGASLGGALLGPSQLLLDRDRGVIALKPTLTVQATYPMPATGNAYSTVFARGLNNITITYRTGYAALGNNLGQSVLNTAQFPRLLQITVSGSTVYADTPEPYALWTANSTGRGGLTLDKSFPLQMLKISGGSLDTTQATDHSAKWTMVSATRLSCALADYDAAATYLFVYVPRAIGRATVRRALAQTLRDKSIRDFAGSAGGASEEAVGPFRVRYGGDFQYDKQAAAADTSARELLRRYASAAIGMG